MSENSYLSNTFSVLNLNEINKTRYIIHVYILRCKPTLVGENSPGARRRTAADCSGSYWILVMRYQTYEDCYFKPDEQ